MAVVVVIVYLFPRAAKVLLVNVGLSQIRRQHVNDGG